MLYGSQQESKHKLKKIRDVDVILMVILVSSSFLFENQNFINNSSRSQVFCKSAALKNLVKFTVNYTCQSLFFMQL